MEEKIKKENGRVFPPELTDKIVEALKENPNAYAVAHQFLVSISAVWLIAKKNRIVLAPAKNREPLESKVSRYQMLIQLVEGGKNLAEATRALGFSYQSARRFLSEQGVSYKGHLKEHISERSRHMIEALRETPNAAAVARQFGVTRQAVHAFAGRKNIPLASAHHDYRCLSDAQKCEIVDALVQCPNAAQVKRGYNIRYKTVLDIAHRAGIELLPGRSVKEQRERILETLREEPDIDRQSLVSQFGITSNYATNMKFLARKKGIPVPETRFPDVLKEKMIEALKENMNVTQTARRFCVSMVGLLKLAHAEGIVLTPRRTKKKDDALMQKGTRRALIPKVS